MHLARCQFESTPALFLAREASIHPAPQEAYSYVAKMRFLGCDPRRWRSRAVFHCSRNVLRLFIMCRSSFHRACREVWPLCGSPLTLCAQIRAYSQLLLLPNICERLSQMEKRRQLNLIWAGFPPNNSQHHQMTTYHVSHQVRSPSVMKLASIVALFRRI